MAKPDFKALMQDGKGIDTTFDWPENCGNTIMKIDRDGRWYSDNSPIGRIELCQLFSTTLRYRDGQYWLITPYEKIEVLVEDAPQVIVGMDITQNDDGQDVIIFTTLLNHRLECGNDHYLEMKDNPQDITAPKPYIYWRDDMWALINRNIYYDLVNLCDAQDTDAGAKLSFTSAGQEFTLGVIA